MSASLDQVNTGPEVEEGIGFPFMAPGGAQSLFGWQWYAKLSAVSFVTGAAMELFMIKTGFCKTSPGP